MTSVTGGDALKIVTLGTFISANMYEDRMNREQFRTT
jgi:hypothetical protein